MECESQGGPSKVGDKHLTYWIKGVQYGTSHGLFQIRHLEKRPPLSSPIYHDPEENIKFAAGMFKAMSYKFGSTAGWYNCAKKTGIK